MGTDKINNVKDRTLVRALQCFVVERLDAVAIAAFAPFPVIDECPAQGPLELDPVLVDRFEHLIENGQVEEGGGELCTSPILGHVVLMKAWPSKLGDGDAICSRIRRVQVPEHDACVLIPRLKSQPLVNLTRIERSSTYPEWRITLGSDLPVGSDCGDIGTNGKVDIGAVSKTRVYPVIRCRGIYCSVEVDREEVGCTLSILELLFRITRCSRSQRFDDGGRNLGAKIDRIGHVAKREI